MATKRSATILTFGAKETGNHLAREFAVSPVKVFKSYIRSSMTTERRRLAGPGADPEFFCEGGGGGGGGGNWEGHSLLRFGRGYEKLRVKEEDVSGAWAEAPAAFLLLSCNLGPFSLYLYHHAT